MSRIPLKPATAIPVLAAAGVAALGAAILAGGAGDLPSDAVARVGDTVIKKSAFDSWLRAAERGQGVAPDPPSFDRCVAAKRKQPRTAGTAPRVDALRRHRNLLLAEGERKALETFMTQFRGEYRGTTTCADGFTIAVCKNVS